MLRDDLIKALRTTKGKVRIGWRMSPDLWIAPNLEKSSVIEQLEQRMPENTETGIYIRADGFIMRNGE